MSVNGKAFRVSHCSGRVAERLHAFMQAHDLGLEELADWLKTHPRTLAQWFNGTAMAPACALISLPLVHACSKRVFIRARAKRNC